MESQEQESINSSHIQDSSYESNHRYQYGSMNSMTKNGKRNRGIYILPSLFTMASLFCGFYSISSSILFDVEKSAYLILLAMIFDGLDGRVARLTNTCSVFGMELDSIVDMVSFGVAPAVLMYSVYMQFFGKIGIVVCFLFVAAVALRLARFNTKANVSDKRYFQGLPCPSGAVVISSFFLVLPDYEYSSTFSTLLVILSIFTSLMMVSSVLYASFKDAEIFKNVSFVSVIIVLAVFSLVFLSPYVFIFSSIIIYLCSGPCLFLYKKCKNKKIC